MDAPLLEVQNLRVRYAVDAGWTGAPRRHVHAVEDVSLEIRPGECLGLVGESGCGKSTLGRAVTGLVRPDAGEVRFRGTVVSGLSERRFRPYRRRIQMIFQDPYSSLDPRLTAGESVGEALDIHGLAADRADRGRRIAALLESVGLEPAHSGRYPSEFSGGQLQRIGIARALAVEPELVVCDEPVSALDVSVQAQVVNLLDELRRDRGLSYLFISHDLAVVGHLCDRIEVMYLGRIVESGPARAVLGGPAHPYTRALLGAMPSTDPSRRPARAIPPGEPPSPLAPPPGCAYHPRCPKADDRCRREIPALRGIRDGIAAACHMPET